MACRIESVAATVPAPDTYPVNTLAITGALVRVVALPTEVTSPVRLALVVTLPAVSPDAVPVIFVPTSAEGVPSAGVTSVGEVLRTTLPVPVLVTTPVPPLATASVPASVIVPVLVIGPPEVVRPVVPPDTATDVTVPLPATVAHDVFVPLVVRNLPLFPVCDGISVSI